jgi:hypothetical protein
MFRAFGSFVAFALALTLATTAAAGGRVDIHAGAVPSKIAAGQSFEIPFTMQYPNGSPVKQASPVLVARCGDVKVESNAKAGAVAGTYVATLKLPKQGAWTFEIDSKICGNKCALAPATVMASLVPARSH